MKMSNSFDESTQKMQIASKIENLLKQFEDEMSDKFKAKSVEGFFDAAIKLCLIFGEELVVEGLSIAENGLVRIVRDEESTFPQVFEVRPGSFCTKSYYIYENINFCNCHFFSDSEKMRKILCVAEKHDAAKNIAKFLSNGNAQSRPGKGKFIWNFLFNRDFENRNASFVFTSVRGHVMNYEFDRKYKAWIRHQIVDLFEGRIDHIVTSNMKEIEANLRMEAKKADTLIIWTDCDREGEHIGNEIVQICCATNPRLDVKRARFSEITNTAIQRAMRNLCRLDEKIVKAVDCRMELDLRIGAAFTRLQTLYFKNEKLHTHFGNNVGLNFDDFKSVISYGSCQFPTLGFVVERYKDRREFVREPFWKLMGKDGINPVNFLWERDKLFDKNVVEAIKNACNNSSEPAKIIEVTKKPKSKWRPQPLDTIQLQRLGSRFLKMNAKTIMTAAEKLYQNGFISYPRTETTAYSTDFDLADIVQKMTENMEWRDFALEIQQRGGPRPRNGNKNDQAHPPIHPVKCANKNSFANNDEWSVYEFICRYFLASVSRDATGMETKVKVGLDEEIFTATGLVIEDLGYLLIYPYEKWQDKNIPNYQEGQILKNFSLIMCEGSTTPPPLLSEADLIALMDKKGIGTDATHAEHIETIKKRWYVIVNNERRFEPTKLGLSLVTAYDKMEHRYKISKPNLRAALEVDLENICKGTRTKDDVLREQLKIYKELYNSTEQKLNLFTQAVQENAQQN